MASGTEDPIMSPDGARLLAAVLQHNGAVVEHRLLPSGQELSQADVSLAKQWWQAQASRHGRDSPRA